MESIIRLHIIPTEEPIPTRQYSIPEDSSIRKCFYINFYYTHVAHFINSEIPTRTTIYNETFLIPWDILCDCDIFQVLDPNSFTITYLHETFSSVPISSELLDSVLPSIGERARQMIELNYEGREILEMDVMAHLTTWPIEDEEGIDNQHASMAPVVNSLEQVKIDDDASSCWTEQCAICLEEFCNGSESKLVRIKCLHVFHEDCIVQWLQHCNTNQSYSCPLCRCQIACN